MLAFDSSIPTDKSREKVWRLWERSSKTYHASLACDTFLHWVPCYSAIYTGMNGHVGSYVPDPNDLEYDGPVRHYFDIYTTPYLA